MILTKVFDFFGFQKTYASEAEYLASPEAEKRLRDELEGIAWKVRQTTLRANNQRTSRRRGYPAAD